MNKLTIYKIITPFNNAFVFNIITFLYRHPYSFFSIEVLLLNRDIFLMKHKVNTFIAVSKGESNTVKTEIWRIIYYFTIGFKSN